MRPSSSPSANNLITGKMVAEDTNTNRNTETIGYMVFESGNASDNGFSYEVNLGADIVRGPTNSPSGYIYNLINNYSNPIAIASQAGMDGANGSWSSIVNLSNNTISLTVDEDQIADLEQSHTTEQVGYFIIDGVGSIQLEPNN